MSSGKNILKTFRHKWRLMQVVEMFLYALGPAILVYFLTSSIIVPLLVFSGILLIGLVIKKPWQLSLEKIGNYIDHNLDAVEYSTSLLLVSENQLSSLASLQRHEVGKTLKNSIASLKPNVSFKKPALVLGLFLLLSVLAQQFNWALQFDTSGSNPEMQETILFKPLDAVKTKNVAPRIEDQTLLIRYPSYTGIGAISSKTMNVKALEGSKLSWQLQFDKPIEEAVFESSDENFSMRKSEKGYAHQMLLSAQGFYNFKFDAVDGETYQSELYALEMFKDESPVVEIQQLKQFTSLDFEEDKNIEFETFITDDFGIAEAYIIATVSKGEGESVKFREERLKFENEVLKGSKNQKLSKRIDLSKMGMEPGDELYFYISAVDTKEPRPNTTRSETYFVVLRDTLTSQFAVEGTMGADLMPDYFRSQRQLIIDTEKLIANKAKLPKKDFNRTSNELGFDQKALRLKYGQFMGDETEVEEEVVEESDDSENEKDPLAEFTHDHDGSNEHNLVDHEHKEEGDEEDKEDPLERYLHNHDDPEESTLFTQSLKSKLRQAMAEMWDAELHLRLYTPENSLPYQYRALKLIQEIKNSARIYVHRIGFDPPPIKEEKRLTGTLDEAVSFQKQEDLTVAERFPFMRKSVEILEQLRYGDLPTVADRKIFSKAGSELAELAILEPSNYLKTLQQLKWISDSNELSGIKFNELLSGLNAAIPAPKPKPKSQNTYQSELNTLLLKELEIND